jgi:hypothetical protein
MTKKARKCDICGKRNAPLVPCGDHWHFACKECQVFIDHGARPEKWTCETCGSKYAEYVNGCVHCEAAGIRSKVECSQQPKHDCDYFNEVECPACQLGIPSDARLFGMRSN